MFDNIVANKNASIELIESFNVLGIFVKIVGRAYCKWRTGAGHQNRINVGEEYYLNEKTFFVGSDNGTKVLVLKV